MAKPEIYEYSPNRPPVLRDRKGDISKRWYIEFYAFEVDTMRLKRKVMYVPSTLSAKERRAWAKPRMDAIKQMLDAGYNIPAKQKNPTVPAPDKITILEAFNYVLRAVVNEFAPDTVRTYKNIIAAFSAYLKRIGLENASPSDIGAMQTAMYLDELAVAGKTNTTINNHLTVLKAISAKMDARGWKNGIGEGVKRRKQVEARNLTFTDAQRTDLLVYFKEHSPGMCLVVLMLYHAFIRPAEICRLKVADIDLQNGVINMAGSQTKNKRNANVPLTKALREVLTAYIDGLPKNYYLIGSGIKAGSVNISPTRLGEAHKLAMDSLKMDTAERSLYTWKDTGACNAYRAGIDIKTLQRLLRHSSVAMTEIYLRSLGESVKENIEGKEW